MMERLERKGFGFTMKKTAFEIAALAIVLFVICVACRLTMHNTYNAYMPIPHNMRDIREEDIQIAEETPEIATHGTPRRVNDSYIRVPIQANREGETWLELRHNGDEMGRFPIRVGRFGTIYDPSTGGFTGDTIVLWAITLFCLAVAGIMFRDYRRMKGPAFYAYATIAAVGFGLFALLTGLYMLVLTLRHMINPRLYNMLSAYDAISNSGFRFMMVTAPFMLAFAVAMAVSNIALLRHERFSVKNILGIGVGLALLLGEALAVWLFQRDFSGSEMEWHVHNTLQNVYATGFAYFECILIGAIYCGFKAARHMPKLDADYILILGCRFRRDGTLTPLLQGRVDRALAFWREQRTATGKTAVLIPSGGQGSDESMPEAEAMRRYMLGQGVPEDVIRLEDRSRNTYQNMEFSKNLIDKTHPNAKVVYATTNYHVFRSGVWASLAGLPAEGVGSKTKWWYWPNAFMRECLGLMLNRIPQELLLLVVMIAFFVLLSMALG